MEKEIHSYLNDGINALKSEEDLVKLALDLMQNTVKACRAVCAHRSHKTELRLRKSNLELSEFALMFKFNEDKMQMWSVGVHREKAEKMNVKEFYETFSTEKERNSWKWYIDHVSGV